MTILTPTNRYHEKKPDRRDELAFKNNVSYAQKMLQETGFTEEEARKFLKPAYDLLEDDRFWTYQSDGLAVFITPEWSEHQTMPLRLENEVYISDHFYVKPFISMFSDAKKFFMLSVSQNQVRFFECTRYSITPVKIKDLMPLSMEESLPDRDGIYSGTVPSGSNGEIHYGHSDDQKDIDIERFFREINDGLMKMLYDEKVPMVLACVDYLRPIYEEVNSYPHLIEGENISGNPENEDLILLKEKAERILEPYFNNESQQAREDFLSLQYSEKSSTDIKEILKAAYDGRIETLLLSKGTSNWGEFTYPDRIVRHISRRPDSKCLYNLAALKTLETGGNVYNLNPSYMPDRKAEIAAIFRY